MVKREIEQYKVGSGDADDRFAGALPMLNRLVRICLASALYAAALSALSASAPTEPTPAARALLGRMPITFEANRGQFDPIVRFLHRGPGYSLSLLPTGAELSLQGARLGLQLSGANPNPKLEGISAHQGASNYMIGADRVNWRTGIPHFGRVRYHQVYPGIDLVFHSSEGILEFDFIVAAGADPSRIRFSLNGADRVTIDGRGDLVTVFGGQTVRQHKPRLYQEIAGAQREVDGGFVLSAKREISFRTGAFDRSKELVIDPEVTFFKAWNGSGSDVPNRIAIDADRNVYVFGNTTSTDFPTTSGAYQPRYRGGLTDTFVTKLSPTGDFVFTTYLGGSATEGAGGIAVDADGVIYLAGNTSSPDFPVTANAMQKTIGGGTDGYIAKLDPTGSSLLYSTFFGGTGTEVVNGMGIDAQKNVYVAGWTTTANLPAQASPGLAVQSTYAGGADDGLIAKLKADGSGFAYLTYLGGNGVDEVTSLAVAPDGTAYLGGTTTSTNFRTTAGAAQVAFKGVRDAFAAKINSSGTSLMFSTYLGGKDDDSPAGVAIAPDGGMIIGGTTKSSDYPTTPNALQTTYGGSGDGFVTRLGLKGDLAVSTFLGGAASDIVSAVTYDPIANGIGIAVFVEAGTLPSPKSANREATALPSTYYYVTANYDLAATIDSIQFIPDSLPHGAGGDQIKGCQDDGRGNVCCGGTYIPPGQGASQRRCAVLCVSRDKIVSTYKNSDGSGNYGDPVSTATGEVYSNRVDFQPSGPMKLGFERYYASFLKSNGVTSAIGNNWMHNFEMKATISGTSASVILFGGKTVKFTNASGLWKLAAANATPYQLLASGTDLKFLDPQSKLVYTFTATGALIRIEDRNGNALTITQSAQGPTLISDGLGRTLMFVYSGSSLTRVQDQTGRSVLFSSAANRLSVTDPAGQTAIYSYTSAGKNTDLLQSETLPDGAKPFTQNFDTAGRVSQQIDSGTYATGFAYDATGGTTMTDPLKATVQHVHQGANLSKIVDAAGQTATIDYDGLNRRTALTDRLGNRTQVTYHEPSGNPATVTDAAGNTLRYTYTAQQQGGFTFYSMTGIVYPDGTSASFTYDAKGNEAGFTDAAGKKTSYTYNLRGQILTQTEPSGPVTNYAYNPDGTVATFKEPSGASYSYAYDSAKRMVKGTLPDGSTSAYSYDTLNRITKAVSEGDDNRSFTYFGNRLASSTDRSGNAVKYQYNSDGLPSTYTNRLGKSFTFTYNELRLVKTTTSPSGLQLTAAYDKLQRPVTIGDSAGPLMALTYNAEGIPVSRTDGMGRTTILTSDHAGRVTAIADALANTTKFAYDSMGRITTVTNALSLQTVMSYDQRGMPLRIAMPAGISAAYSRNDSGNLTGVTDPNGNAWAISYDAFNRISSRTDPLGNSSKYAYDNRQRVEKVTMASGGTVAFTRDASGNLVRRLYSDGTDLKFSYDKNRRLIAANGMSLSYDAEGREISSNGLNVQRDEEGRVISMSYGDAAKTVTYSYDSRGQIARISDWAGGSVDLTYNSALQTSSVTRSNGVATAYSYDGAGRLNGIAESKDGSLSLIAMTLDAAGRVVAEDRNVPTVPALTANSQSFSYDAASQVAGWTYDADGRLSGDGVRTFQWDGASRMAGYTGPDASVRYGYDARGMLTARAGRNFVVNHAFGSPLIAVARDGDVDLRYYVYTPRGRLLYSIEASDGSHRYYHFDESANTIFLTSDAGAITDSYGIAPFGEVVTHVGPSDNPFTYMGALGVMQEGSGGLYYMQARYYDASSVHFLTRDPLARVDRVLRLNPYQFAELNPISKADPTGLDLTHISEAQYVDLASQEVNGIFQSYQRSRNLLAQAQSVLSTGLARQIYAGLHLDPDNSGALASNIGYQLSLRLAVNGAGQVIYKDTGQVVFNSQGPVNLGTAISLLRSNGAGPLLASAAANYFNSNQLQLRGSGVVSNDSAGLITNDGGTLITNDGGTLITNDGGTLITNDGGTLVNVDSLLANAPALIAAGGGN